MLQPITFNQPVPIHYLSFFEKIIIATLIIIAIYIGGKIFWMCYYEWKFGKQIENAGEKYLQYGKEYFKK